MLIVCFILKKLLVIKDKFEKKNNILEFPKVSYIGGQYICQYNKKRKY